MLNCDAKRTTMICIDSYANQNPVGRMYNMHYNEIQPFHSLSQLLFMIEQSLDDLKFPQAFESIRRFETSKRRFEKSDCAVKMLSGNLATFSVKILFRQNASWQGAVHWLEGNSQESFRSVLELISLLDSAITEKKASQLES